MKKRGALKVLIAVAIAVSIAAYLGLNVLAAESPGEKAVHKDLEQGIGMPILDGELWQKMTQDDKVSFIWGFWHAVSIEHYLMGKYPELKRDNFSAKVIEASGNKPLTMTEIISLIDKYYQTSPDEIEKPVVGVLWDELIKGNIKTGINGRPLKP
jgi:hypothetical protein